MSLQDETFTLGVEEEFQIIDPHTHELLRQGNGAARQREVYKRSGQLKDVVRYVVAETALRT